MADMIQKKNKKTNIYAVFKTHVSSKYTYKQSERTEDSPCKLKSKEIWSSNIHVRQNRPKIKNIKKDKEGQ